MTADDERLIDWAAVTRGATLGLGVLAAVSVTDAVLDHSFAHYRNSGWRAVLFVVILVGYLIAGWTAGHLVPDAGLSNGALAGIGSVVAWIPVRVAIWLVRDTGVGLFHGTRAPLVPSQVFGTLVISAGIAMLGGHLGARAAARAGRSSP